MLSQDQPVMRVKQGIHDLYRWYFVATIEQISNFGRGAQAEYNSSVPNRNEMIWNQALEENKSKASVELDEDITTRKN